jgi:hypothetical protein
VWRCRCGYEFGQSIETIRMLRHDQQTTARIVIILLLLDAAALRGIAYAMAQGFVFFPSHGFIALTTATVTTARKLLITRESLRQFANRETLPAAIIYRLSSARKTSSRCSP